MARRNLVVIGGGLAGSLLCNVLAGDFQVTLLEKGPRNNIEYPQFRFLGKKLAEVHTCCYGAGGTTNLWHNGLIPINDEDVVDQEFAEVLRDAQTYIDETAAALFYAGSSFSEEHRQLKDHVNSLSPALAAFSHGIDCLVYPKKFQALRVSPKVEAVYSVEGIDFVLNSGRIAAIRYLAGGQERTMDVDTVIIAAGTLGTPGVVQKIVSVAGLSELSVGNGFIDHPMGFVGKVKIKKNLAPVIRKLSALDRGDYISRNAIRLKSSCGKYTACAFFRPALTMDNRLDIYKYKSSLGASSGIVRLKNALSKKIFHPDIIAEIFAHLFGVNIPSRVYNILLIAEQKRGDSRVFEKDGKIHVDWSISAEELPIYQGMLKDFKEMISGLAEEININTAITDDWLWSAAHHSGTVSLGLGDDDLVDANLRLKCCNNAYVCDGSVLQEHSYANTGLAIGQLAFRLAAHLTNSRGHDS